MEEKKDNTEDSGGVVAVLGGVGCLFCIVMVVFVGFLIRLFGWVSGLF